MKTKMYYKLMSNIGDTFEEINKNWFKCFLYSFKKFEKSFTEEAVRTIYYDFEMSNWKAIHKEGTIYANYDEKELLEAFKAELRYISDRPSYDRLFRAHWLFRHSFHEELNKVRFPSLYKN